MILLPKNIKGAIFDLDGTLLDSLNAWTDVDRRFFEKRGLPLPPDYADAIKAMDLQRAAVYTKERFSLPECCGDIMAEWREMIAEEYACRVPMKAGAAGYLRALASCGVKLGLATSSEPPLYLPALRRYGVADLFSAYALTGETREKEFPDVYLLAARRLGVSPADCAVFEDILPGIRSAKRAGFFTVAVPDAASEPDPALLRAEADATMERYPLRKNPAVYIT